MTVLETERKNLKTLSDEELVKAAQNGDNEALEAILSRYKNLVYAKSKPYFLAGADDDDIIQDRRGSPTSPSRTGSGRPTLSPLRRTPAIRRPSARA